MFIVTWHALLEDGNAWVAFGTSGNTGLIGIYLVIIFLVSVGGA